MSELIVKLARPEDAETLVELLNQARQYKLERDDDAWTSVPFTIEELQQRIEKGNTYAAWRDNELVGTLVLLWEDKMTWGNQPPIAVYLHQLAINDDHRGLGLGAKLLDWADHQAAKNGRELLRIDIPPENKGLRDYYRKIGFKWVKNREVHAPHATYIAALYERPITQQ